MGVQTAGGATAGNRAAGLAVLQGAAKPPVDQPTRPPGPNDLAVTFEPRERALVEPDGGRSPLIGENLDVRETAAVIDRDVDELPARTTVAALGSSPRDAMPRPV